jgi:hypothetical protein
MKDPNIIDSSHAGLRKFGFTMAGIFGVLGVISVWRHPGRSAVFASIAMVFLVMVLVKPAMLKIPQRLWMGLAFRMGAVMTKVIMVVVYYLILTPLALVAKVTGRDFLRVKNATKNTYWIDSAITKENKEAYLRQF